MSSKHSHAGILSISDDDDDDDDDDSITWEQKYDTLGSAVSCDGDQGACSSKQQLPRIKQEPRECVKQEANRYPVVDLSISSSDDEEMASFAAAFDSQPVAAAAAAAAGRSNDTQTGEHVRSNSPCIVISSSECSDDSDDELTAAAWQRLHPCNTGGCNVKVENTDDFIPLVNEPAEQPLPGIKQEPQETYRQETNMDPVAVKVENIADASDFIPFVNEPARQLFPGIKQEPQEYFSQDTNMDSAAVKVENIDDAPDFIPLVNEPAEATGNISSFWCHCCCCSYQY